MAEKRSQLPPQNIETEQSVLGCLLIDKNAITKIADFLTPKDFYKKSHQEIYKTVTELFEKGEAIDLLSVTNRLKEKKLLKDIGGNSYLTELINKVPTAAHVIDYAKTIQRKRVLRDLIESSQEINTLGYSEEEDIEVLLDRAEQKIFSIAQQGLTQKFIPVKSTLEEAFGRMDKLSKEKGGIRGLPTGFKSLDNMLAGLQKSDLVILASRPSMGKTSLALNIATNVAIDTKTPVGIFSLEMSKDQLADRLIASLSNVDLWKLRTGKLKSKGEDNDFSRIQHAMGVLSEAPIYVDDAATANVLQMRAMARRLQAQHGLGLIVIDYLQLVTPRDSAAGIVQQVTEISRSLKGLARELNIPVLALSQLSRLVERRTPQIPKLADLRDSGCLESNTLITRADTGERIPIKQLEGKTNIPVLSLNSNLKLEKTIISKVFCSGRKKLYELKTKSGFKIKASGNHPFLKASSWSRLDQLSAGDRIAVPREINIKPKKEQISDDELILLAHLLEDGCILPNQPFHYTSSDYENIKVVAEKAKSLFDIRAKIVRQKNWWHVYLPSPCHNTHRKFNPITEWYKKLGIERVRSWKKEIPEAVFCSNKEKISLFLKHLWATDGNLSVKKLKKRKPSASIYYSTTSPKMAEQIKELLVRTGIRSKITEARKENYRVCYHIIIQGKENQLKFLKKIGSYGERGRIIPKLVKYLNAIETNTNLDVIPKEIWERIAVLKTDYNLSWRNWAEKYGVAYNGSTLLKNGISRTRMKRIIKFMPAAELKDLADSDVYWDEIISIKPLKTEKVYDAAVPKNHNFIANGIIVHNSLEQDCDVAMFIYREDRYREDTSRKNIADIIIAKHRNGPIGKAELYFDEQRATFRNLEKEEYLTDQD